MSKQKFCEGLFDHQIDNLETIGIDKFRIHKRCPKCGYEEALPRSRKNVLFTNTLVQQKKKWAYDDNRKEALQPMNPDGSVNDDFTEAYGYNPLDDRTKDKVPRVQGGNA